MAITIIRTIKLIEVCQAVFLIWIRVYLVLLLRTSPQFIINYLHNNNKRVKSFIRWLQVASQLLNWFSFEEWPNKFQSGLKKVGIYRISSFCLPSHCFLLPILHFIFTLSSLPHIFWNHFRITGCYVEMQLKNMAIPIVEKKHF